MYEILVRIPDYLRPGGGDDIGVSGDGGGSGESRIGLGVVRESGIGLGGVRVRVRGSKCESQG